MRIAFALVALVGPLAAAACSSSSSASGALPDAGPSGDGYVRDPDANCVKPGTPNNSLGLGGYCTTAADCIAGQTICTAQFGAPDDAWFCSKVCTDGVSCGEGEYCATDARGIACVPLSCAPTDGGPDGDIPPHDASAD